MVAQFAKNGNDNQHVERRMPDLHVQVDALSQWVEQSAKDGTAAHQVERGLFDKLLALGKSLFGGFLNLVGPGDCGETVTLDDGRLVHRSAELHGRRLKTVFGEFMLARWVYAQREGTRFEFMPTDQRLQLPASEVSYLLQEWDQLLGIEHAFGKVREVIQAILRLPQSVDTLEHTNQQMATAAPVFRETQGPVDPSKEGKLLVVTEDNKGIPMVRPVADKPVGAHRTKGEKANKKQMACIGCVYSVDPHPRTPEQLVAMLFRDPDRPKEQPPGAQNKRYWAELSRDIDGQQVRGQDLVFQHLQAEIKTRRQPEQWLVHLCDGQHSLETDRQAYLPEDAHTMDVLDLMHVLPRVWEAAHLFHREGSAEAVGFVRDNLTRILKGEVVQVVAGFRQRDVPGPERCQEKAIANDVRLLDEQQAPDALPRVLGSGLSDCDRRDRRRLPPRDQGPHGTSWHALANSRCPSDVELENRPYQRRLGSVPRLPDLPWRTTGSIPIPRVCGREWPAFQAA